MLSPTAKGGLHKSKSPSPSDKESKSSDSEEDTEELGNEEDYSQRNSFDLSVLIGDAHSLIRFSLYTRVHSKSEDRDLANLPLSDSSSESSDDEQADSGKTEEESHGSVHVKLKKKSNVPEGQHHTTVTLEYSDTQV